MAAQSNILAWEIPWTEEPGRLLSMGPQKGWTQLSDSTTTVSHGKRWLGLLTKTREKNQRIKQVSELWRTHYLKCTQKKGGWKRMRRNAQNSRKESEKATVFEVSQSIYRGHVR